MRNVDDYKFRLLGHIRTGSCCFAITVLIRRPGCHGNRCAPFRLSLRQGHGLHAPKIGVDVKCESGQLQVRAVESYCPHSGAFRFAITMQISRPSYHGTGSAPFYLTYALPCFAYFLALVRMSNAKRGRLQVQTFGSYSDRQVWICHHCANS